MKVTGKNIINWGFRQGKWFGEALKTINENEWEETENEKHNGLPLCKRQIALHFLACHIECQ